MQWSKPDSPQRPSGVTWMGALLRVHLSASSPLETFQWYMKAAALSATVQGRDRVRSARANEETGLPEQS